MSYLLENVAFIDGVAASYRERDDPNEYWEHVLVRMPDGRILDVTGARTRKEVKEQWGPYLWTIPRSRVADFDCGLQFVTQPECDAFARAMVDYWKPCT